MQLWNSHRGNKEGTIKMAALVLHRIISVQIGDKMKLGEYQDLYYMEKLD